MKCLSPLTNDPYYLYKQPRIPLTERQSKQSISIASLTEAVLLFMLDQASACEERTVTFTYRQLPSTGSRVWSVDERRSWNTADAAAASVAAAVALLMRPAVMTSVP